MNNISVYYRNNIDKTENDSIYEDAYNKAATEEYNTKNGKIFLIFNGNAFAGKSVIINNKDTFKFKNEPNEYGCYGVKLKQFPKNTKQIKLQSEGRPMIIIPIKKDYRFINVGNSSYKPWGILYSQFMPSSTCI